LARHFHSEIVMLHVVTALSHATGVPEDNGESTGWDLLTEIIKEAQKQQDQSLGAELDGLTIRRRLVTGDPAWTIVQIAEEEEADLIMMPSSVSTFEQFLLGSVTAKVLSRTECPVWACAHVQESLVLEFAVRNVLCAVDLGPRSDDAVSWAAPLAGESTAAPSLPGARQSCPRAGLALSPHFHTSLALRPAPASSSVPLPWFPFFLRVLAPGG
jgi:nucleotide-binding universal stress UspA family protein